MLPLTNTTVLVYDVWKGTLRQKLAELFPDTTFVAVKTDLGTDIIPGTHTLVVVASEGFPYAMEMLYQRHRKDHPSIPMLFVVDEHWLRSRQTWRPWWPPREFMLAEQNFSGLLFYATVLTILP